jgi:hypothetical protein
MTTPLGSVTGGGKFVLDKAVVGDIMKHDPNLIAAVDAAARKVLPDAGPNARCTTTPPTGTLPASASLLSSRRATAALTKAAGMHGARVTGGGAP